MIILTLKMPEDASSNGLIYSKLSLLTVTCSANHTSSEETRERRLRFSHYLYIIYIYHIISLHSTCIWKAFLYGRFLILRIYTHQKSFVLPFTLKLIKFSLLVLPQFGPDYNKLNAILKLSNTGRQWRLVSFLTTAQSFCFDVKVWPCLNLIAKVLLIGEKLLLSDPS